jgi:Cu-processing system ATP-binding protein
MTNIVELDKVTKSFGSLQALKGVTFELKAGEVLGLFGHNGAGKTTLMKLILGLLSPDGGKLNVFGQQAGASKQAVGFLPENVSFYDQLTGLEVLTYFARLKRFKKADALDLLDKVGLSHAKGRQVKTYSKGMRQRLGLAQAFIGKPKLLLLDEPTVGLDPVATQSFYGHVDELKADGCAVILCSHVLPGVERHIDRAMIVSSGQVQAIGTLEQLAAKAAMPVKIKAVGLNGALYADERYRQFMTPDKADEILVPSAQKLAVLQQLLSHPGLQDLSVESPNLEQLYRHFAEKDESTSNVEAHR